MLKVNYVNSPTKHLPNATKRSSFKKTKQNKTRYLKNNEIWCLNLNQALSSPPKLKSTNQRRTLKRLHSKTDRKQNSICSPPSSYICCRIYLFKRWVVSPTDMFNQYSGEVCQEKGIHSKISISIFSSREKKNQKHTSSLYLFHSATCLNVYVTRDKKFQSTHPNQLMWGVNAVDSPLKIYLMSLKDTRDESSPFSSKRLEWKHNCRLQFNFYYLVLFCVKLILSPLVTSEIMKTSWTGVIIKNDLIYIDT